MMNLSLNVRLREGGERLYLVCNVIWLRKLDDKCCDEEETGSSGNVATAENDESAMDSEKVQPTGLTNGWDI